MTDVVAGLRLALGLLSIVPVGAVPEPTRPRARWAMLLAPVAAAPVALAVAAVVGVGAWWAASPLLVGVSAVAASALLTRAMHLDGLADTADGLGSGAPAERALALMRRGDVGPMGVVTLVLTLLAQAGAYAVCATAAHGWLVAAVAVCVSRAALPIGATFPAARPDGLGALVAGTVPGVGATVVAVAGVGALGAAAAGSGSWPLWAGGVAAGVGLAGAVVVLARCRRRLGGLTGDVLGAGVEVALTLSLLTLAVTT